MRPIRMAYIDQCDRAGKAVTVEPVSGTVVCAIREDGPIDAYIRQYLNRFHDDADNIHVLLPSAEHFERPVEDRHRRDQKAQTIFSDGGQVLLASASSLAFAQRYIKRDRCAWMARTKFPPLP